MNMTIQELGVLLAWIAGILTSLGVIGAFLHFAIVRPLRKYIKEVVKEVSVPAKETARQLKTRNGKNAGEFIEDSAHSLAGIHEQLETMNKALALVNERGIENRGLIVANHSEHIEHLLKYHGGTSDD